MARTMALAGEPVDDGEWYKPTLPCPNEHFMLFRINLDRIRFRPRLGEEGNLSGKNFLFGFAVTH
jgi:hypothetical protein